MGRGDKQSYRYFRSLGSPCTHNTFPLLLHSHFPSLFPPPHCHLPADVPTTLLPYCFLSLSGFWNCTADSQLQPRETAYAKQIFTVGSPTSTGYN